MRARKREKAEKREREGVQYVILPNPRDGECQPGEQINQPGETENASQGSKYPPEMKRDQTTQDSNVRKWRGGKRITPGRYTPRHESRPAHARGLASGIHDSYFGFALYSVGERERGGSGDRDGDGAACPK